MTSVVYQAILFIFILGAGMTFINDTGLYSPKMPTSGLVSNNTQAMQFNEAMTASSKDNLNVAEQLWLMGSCIVGGVVAVLTLGPMLQSFGIPPSLVTWLISPLGVVLAFWMIEMWLGRSPE